MPKVTDIQPQKKRQGYYNIFLDGEYYCALSDLSLSTSGIRVGNELTLKESSTLKSNAMSSKVYNRAIFYLRYGNRTTGEMRRYLLDKEYSEEIVSIVVEKLCNEHYLDDSNYIENFIATRSQLKPKSIRQLKTELISKKLDKDLIDVSLDKLDEDFEFKMAQRVYEKKSKLSRFHDQKKMMQYIMHQGFSYVIAKRVMEEGGEKVY